MKNKFRFLTALVLLVTGCNYAQIGIGTSEPKGALDITSTTNGLLVPRMTTINRNVIANPANALLIFNTTNNTFEVYKSTCACWVSINDQENTPSSNLVNTAPKATTLNLSGKFIVGQTITLTYIYADAQNDLQGFTSVLWQRASTSVGGDLVTISGATSFDYTFQPGDLGTYVRAIIYPRAVTGVLNGVPTTTGWTLVEASATPTADNLTVTGTTSVGNVLSANYVFTGGSGTENTTPATFDGTPSGTSYIWQSANSNAGDGINNVDLYGAFAYTPTFTPQNDLLGKFVRIAVRAKDNTGLEATNFVNSPWVGPITATAETAPVASNVTYSPVPAVALVHTASYSYYDINFDPEAVSTFQWYRANDAAGNGAVAIAGASSLTYTAVPEDGNKFIGFGVTPVAKTGTTTGTEVRYYNSNIVAPVAAFTFTASSIRQLPFYHVSRALNARNAIQVEVNVTSAGGLSISSPVVNGYSFTGSFTLTTGTQWLTLTPNGTQIAYNSSGDLVTLTGVGTTTETKSINIEHVRFGSQYTAHFNGFNGTTNINNALATYTTGETFNNNTSCTTSLISASSCPSGNTVTGESGIVYPTVLINEQCWMQTNLGEVPSNYASLPAWNNTTIADLGQHGFYNVASPSGTAGWAVSAPSALHGRLYQWSAAMNGATHERAQGACPNGWHVPSDCEWKYLEHGVGMPIASQNTLFNNRGAVSQKLRSTATTGGTNTSGFSLVFVGTRSENGAFGGNNAATGSSNVWSSTFSTSWNGGASNFRLFSTATTIFWEAWKNNRTCSVRCLKD